MPSWNLKRNGPIAKYLGFVLNEPPYHPHSFCSLLWMLLFSPLIFVFFRFVVMLKFFVGTITNTILNYHQWRIRNLALAYRREPNLALLDFYQHMSTDAWEIPEYERARPEWLVVGAFDVLRQHFNVEYNFKVLIALGAIESDNQHKLRKIMENQNYWRPSPRQQFYEALSAWIFPLFGLGGLALFLLPLLLTLPEATFVFCIFSIIVIAAVALSRVEGYVVVYNLYKAIKDRTCPLINWV